MENFLEGKKHIHFIGIGGNGMAPLAQILVSNGYNLTGSDIKESPSLDAVRKIGVRVIIGQKAENIEGADLVVYSAAISEDNPELTAAKKSVLTVERSVMLGLITEYFNKAICVSGTHGKTTSCSMLATIMMSADIDFTAVIGGRLKELDGGGRAGKSEYMVCEACEFANTFLKLSPNISIVLNIDNDHLDFFHNMECLKNSFTKFCSLTSDIIVANGDDSNTMEAVNSADLKARVITYGLTEKNEFYPENIRSLSDMCTVFTLIHRGQELSEITLNVPGMHNVSNACAVCAAAYSAGIDISFIRTGLERFSGAKRRFEIKTRTDNGIMVVDDYAHHTTELEAVLKTARAMNYKRIWVVHQPYTYSRTAILLDEFARVLSKADKVILTEIIGVREKNTWNIHAQDLADKIDGCILCNDFEKITEYIYENIEAGDFVITAGAGDIYKVSDMLAEKLC